MDTNMERMRIKRATIHTVPAAANRIFHAKDKVLVWREKQVEHRIEEWLDQFEEINHDQENKTVHVKDPADDSITQFSAVNVKPFIQLLLASDSFMSNCNKTLAAFRSPNETSIDMTVIIEPADPRSRSLETIEAIKKEEKVCSNTEHSK